MTYSESEFATVWLPNAETFLENRIKQIFIVIKVGYIMIMMILATFNHAKKNRRFTPEIILFAFFFIEMVCLVIYEFGTKYI